MILKFFGPDLKYSKPVVAWEQKARAKENKHREIGKKYGGAKVSVGSRYGIVCVLLQTARAAALVF